MILVMIVGKSELVKCIFGIVLKYFILNVQGQGVT